MKKIASILFCLVVITTLGAQENLPEMGLALRHNTADGRLYVNHRDHPFGARLKITNLVNDAYLEVNVEGKPSHPRALIELSPLASDFLGMPPNVLVQVFIEVLSVPTAAPAMRTRTGHFIQTGNASVMGSRTDLSASHPSIPIGRTVSLTNTGNGRSVNVTVTARCRATVDRVIEISPAAGRALGIQSSGQIRLETR